MKNRSVVRKALTVLFPTIILVLVLGVGGAQQTNTELFLPLSQIYQYIKSCFYWPERIDDQEALYGAMKGMVKQLNDPHSEFLDPNDYERFENSLQSEFSGVGIEITIKDGILTVIAPLAETPAEQAGVLAGDQVLKIDGEPTVEITLTEASVKIRGEVGTTVVLLVRHKDGREEEISIVRGTIPLVSVTSKLVAADRIGYIRISRFSEDVTLELDTALLGFDLDGLDGLILDLRNNGGGFTEGAVRVASRFIDSGLIFTSKGRISGPQKYWSTGNVVPNLPLVVLINGGTASAAEIVAGAIRDNNMGILIGEQSFGKGVMQILREFPDGSALKLTTAEYFTPLEHAVHGVGLPPDIEVAEDEDPIEVAIAWIDAHLGVLMPIPLNDRNDM